MVKVILSTVVVLFMVGCGNDAGQSAKSETKEVKEEVKAAVADVKEEVAEAKTEVKSAVSEAKTEVKSAVSKAKVEAKSAVSEAKQETKAIVKETKTMVKEKKAAVEEVIAAVKAPAVDAANIYKVCAGCHGADASKSALNKSQIIKGWDAKKIADALHGYKNGTYGGAMKGLMGAQVSKLSDAEIEALSTYISKF